MRMWRQGRLSPVQVVYLMAYAVGVVLIPSTMSGQTLGVKYQGETNTVDEIDDTGGSVVGHETRRGDSAPDGHRVLSRVKRKSITSDHNLWPDGVIVYTLADEVVNDDLIRSAIEEAIDVWQQTTCIKFFRETETDLLLSGYDKVAKYVRFVRGVGCHSSVGRSSGVGPQLLSISRACAYPEMVTHEIGHLVGFWHEHARWDRDNNVIIMWNNVRPRAIHNFDKVPRMRLLAPYDLSSMMHYSMKTFSVNGERTIRPADERLAFLIGYRRDLSFYDLKSVHELYRCAAKCSPFAPTCENEGFLTKNCTCRCPRGLYGVYCHQIRTDTECGGMLYVHDGLRIQSPGYPDNYPNKMKCTWLLQSPASTVMKLTFQDFDIERAKSGTCRDRLEIRYHHIGIERGPTFCGTEFNGTIVSSTNRMILHFQSNSRHRRKGFKATITLSNRLECDHGPCKNGGSCQDIPQIGTFYCHCKSGWVGKTCNVALVHGGLSDWAEWSECKATCGVQSRYRTCTNPQPQNGGRECIGQAYQSRRCGDRNICRGYFRCNFGAEPNPDDCGIVQLENRAEDNLDWMVHSGQTPSLNTGPIVGHTTGRHQDVYLYIEASLGRDMDEAVFWLPRTKWNFGLYCLQFYYNMRGRSMGTLQVLRQYSDNAVAVMWQRSGNHGNGWKDANIIVLLYDYVKLGFKGIRGDAYDSDMALDDISISPGECLEKTAYYGCMDGERRYSVGPFSYIEDCTLIQCYCNTDGFIDCPDWMRTDSCGDHYEA